MKFDAIVTEHSKSLPSSPWIKLLVAAPFFVSAFYLAGDRNTAEPIPQAKPVALEEIKLVRPQAQHSRSLLKDLAPIANADAAVRIPNSAQSLAAPAASEIEISQTDVDTVGEPAQLEKADSLAVEEPQLTRLQDKLITVKRGDSLSILFGRNSLKASDWMALAKLKGDARRLLKLRPGDQLQLGLDSEGHVAALDMRLDELRSLKIRRDDDGKFQQSVVTDNFEVVQKRIRGSIENSLFLSAKAAGMSDKLTMEFTEIFAWDVDFALDIRSGDSFELLYEEIQKDGKKLRDGKILAAEFTNRGKAIAAVRYLNENDQAAYYSPEGKPMKKAFLRSPVDFTRISSRFSLGRKHPILNKIRAHKGVDYAAARGTPIRAAGAGKVVFAGNKGGYGRVVILQHAGKYKTLYAHMKSFRRGIRRGASVAQGETIGYVGSSGLATGPHLHYEFLVGGRHVDPLRVKLPSAPAIAKAELSRFEAQTKPLLARLKNSDSTELALAD